MNGLLGNQARIGPFAPETHTTGFIYMLPLGGGGLTKPWGASNSYLPCCWGTLSETFAKLSDSIFWESADASTLFGYLVKEHHLRCRPVTEQKLNAVRISTHVFNSRAECERVG